MAVLFGWKFQEQKNREETNLQSFTPPENDDGSAVVGSAGVYGTYLNLEGTFQSEFDLIARYRAMIMHQNVKLQLMKLSMRPL